MGEPGKQPELPTMSGEWYEELWQQEWMDYSRYGPTRRHVRKIIRTLVAPLQVSSVLDIGCGEGSLLSELGAIWPTAELAGTDISAEALRYARELVPRASFASLDLERAALPQTAELTICCEVLEHLQADEAAIANLAAMTTRFVVIVVPQGRMRGFERGNVGHVRNYTRAELCAKLERGGFAPLKVVEWGFPFFSPLYRNLLDRIPSGAVKGRMNWRKRLMADFLYRLFELNAWDRGDKLVVLAARKAPAS